MIHPLRACLFFLCLFSLTACQQSTAPADAPVVTAVDDTTDYFDRDELLETAEAYLDEAPVPLTASVSERSAGGPRDFYSEGDYWWPDPANPDGPYIRRDGESNPENFVAHRLAMVDMSKQVATLVAAYKLTGEEKYADKAMEHLRAWFVSDETSMMPNLLYAQAISGRVTGRGIGIIDTIHLIEVAKAIEVLRALGYLDGPEDEALTGWFDQYLTWMTTHEYGLAERDNGNNHSTWWAAQVAAFASVAGREAELGLAREAYKNMLTVQMDSTGGFPQELERTKPYIYTLFNLEGFAVLADYGSRDGDHKLWDYESADGDGSLQRAFAFMAPYLMDKDGWPYPPDVAYYDEVPIQSPGMLLAARAYDDEQLLDAWKELDPERKSQEIERNFPIRRPSLWVE
ncbi:hypothetical protein LEM8419_03300 [Neolewinella maritima]|uniref:Alginate lyase domain-containing protein n=1 Tax=Neolewinella maritima TaxID=1383882 RepID=A0ABN8FDC5_9BACT|nr:alginate lyase family protein [Neolewinella maritima]CAH1002414.1 hypothetical protein LEM8419_03300 [Neolewinella maritima]